MFNEGLNRVSGSMQTGSKDTAVKRFDLNNFKMEVQKKTSQEFQDEGANHISIDTSSAPSDR